MPWKKRNHRNLQSMHCCFPATALTETHNTKKQNISRLAVILSCRTSWNRLKKGKHTVDSSYLDYSRTVVTFTTLTVKAAQQDWIWTWYNKVPIKSSSNSDSLICKVVLSSSVSSGCELYLFTSKQSHCLLFFHPLLFHARPVKEMYSNSLGLWSPPPQNLHARFAQCPLLSCMPVWKLTLEVDTSLRLTTESSYTFFDKNVWFLWANKHHSDFFALVFVRFEDTDSLFVLSFHRSSFLGLWHTKPALNN